MGGQHNFVKEKLSKSLSRHGIGVHTHWSWDKKRPPQTFPQGIDLVYICTDMVGHTLSVPCMDWARERGLPYVNGTRKWAESILRLTQGGFPLVDPFNSVPEIIAEIRLSRPFGGMDSGPNEEEMQALAAAFTGDIEAAKKVVAAYNAETGHVHLADTVTTSPVMPLPITLQEPEAMHTTSLFVTNPKQREYLRALAFNPDSDNLALWRDLENQLMFAGAKFDPERASSARKSLGIVIVRKGGRRTVHVNTTMFTAALKMAKIEGFNIPQTIYTGPDNALRSLPPRPVAAPFAPPIAAPATPAPVPAPVVPVLVTSERWPNADFKDLLVLLRDHMSTHNIKLLTITETGVSFKRIEVVEGDLAL